MVHYSYYYYRALNLHVIIATRNNGDNTFSVRPVAAYFSAKSAQTYVSQYNEYLASGRKGTAPRCNPSVRFLSVPNWWIEKYPNWAKMHEII